MRRISVLIALGSALFFSGCGGSNDSHNTSVSESSAHQSTTMLQTGAPSDLIVVFDDAIAVKNTASFQQSKNLTSASPEALAFKKSQIQAIKVQALSQMGPGALAVVNNFSHLPMTHVRVNSPDQLAQVKKLPGVIGVYENQLMQRQMLAQSLPLIAQPQALASGKQGAGTSVVVLDTRIDYSISAFGACTSPGVPASCKVIYSQDVAGLPNDGLGFQDGHGTNVAATVLAVAPGTKIIGINVFNGGSASDVDVINGINWAIAHAGQYNIVAINMSLGGGSGDTQPKTASPYYSAFQNARAAGIIPVTAAGNDGFTNKLLEPGSVVGSVSVGAVYDSAMGPRSWSNGCRDSLTIADQVICFSNSAYFLTLLAPGCKNDAGLTSSNYMCGTSQAAPHVAGSIAVLRSAFPGDAIDQTVARLKNGDTVSDGRNGISTPRINLSKALGLGACTYSLSSNGTSFGASESSGNTVSVLTSAGCAWSASENLDWLTVTNGSSGIGNGVVQYYVSPNNSTATRSGTISIAGQTFSVQQAAGAGSLSNASGVWLNGKYRYQTQGLSSVTLGADQILNSSNRTTGTLRLELWLTKAVVPAELNVSGWQVATYQIAGPSNGRLGPSQYFQNVSAPVLLTNLPPPGMYYASLIVSENGSCTSNNGFCPVALGNFSGQFFIPDTTAPSAPSGVVANPAGATQINLSWNASWDDVAVTSYKVYNNAIYIGSVMRNSATVSALNPLTQYSFSISACDSSKNCSARSNSVSASTPMAIASGVWWNPAENGRGYTIEVRGNTLVFYTYLFDASGNATWYGGANAMNSNGTVDIQLQEYAGGQPLLGAYKAPLVKGNVTNARLVCSTSTTCTLTWAGGTVPIQRFQYAGSPQYANSPESGLWWDPSASGRGYFVDVQGDTFAFYAYLYDQSGRATWYLSAGKLNPDGSYDGQLQEYVGGQSLLSAYKQAPSVKGNVGSVRWSCSSTTTCQMTWPGGTFPIQRFVF